MPREVVKLLHDIVSACEAVEGFLTGHSQQDFADSLLLQSAVERQLFIVGEAMSQLRQIEPELVDQFEDWRSIIAFRNLVAHGYFAVDPSRVWSIATDEIRNTAAISKALLDARR
jgi:uncharacterized protein with HEPN domain